MSKHSSSKQMKKYYYNDKLNRGYQEDSVVTSNTSLTSEDRVSKKYEYLLPPVEVLSEYEEIFPGTLEKILNMAKKEQELKYDLEKILAISTSKTKKIGALFGFCTVMVICLSAVKISTISINASLIFSLIGFLGIFGICLLSKLNIFRKYNNSYRDRGKSFNNYRDKPRFNNRHKFKKS